jgi:hypothetical protein
MPVFSTSITPNYSSQQSPSLHEDSPSLRPNYELRPKCKADERIFLWKGVNTPPPSVINDPVIRMLADLASHESLCDTSGPGSAIKKFHTFCDTFSIPETQRLPASFEVLHSFALWVVTDPKALDASLVANTHLNLYQSPRHANTSPEYEPGTLPKVGLNHCQRKPTNA